MGEESAQRFEKTITKEVAAQYLVVKPKDYDAREKYPLLIFLHGRGEQGDQLDLVKRHGPFKKIAELGLPLLIVAPQSPQDEWWDIDMLEALVEEVIDDLDVDEDRVYLTGLSMGGSATWRLAARRPGWFAAIVPICGRSVPSKAARLRNMPVWVFHGARDRTVPVKETTDMVDALHKVGSDPRLTIYPEARHNAWTQTYNNPELYEWLLSHRRGSDGDWPSDRRGRRGRGDGDRPSDR
ncbi:MAG: prolyl oligopeptidase family serine peptidase, partial [Planctomycetes bacterium]|nr:prolyl oligopeptidase family serine peptidase [Planctomycetota bacterium]